MLYSDMQSCDWVELLQKIPAQHQENLLFVTGAGLEISLQSILQIGAQHMLIRGRQGGTTETGRVFCIPYHQITYLMFIREVKDAQLQEMFGEIVMASKLPPAEEEATAESALLTDTVAIADQLTPIPEPPKPTLRDRLRARLGLSSPTMGLRE